MNRQYEKDILQNLLTKYQKRADEGKEDTSRRIFLKPSAICRGYGGRNIDIAEKEAFDFAVEKCARQGFISFKRLPESALIESIWLNPDAAGQIEQYLMEAYGIMPKPSMLEQFKAEIRQGMTGPLTRAYGNSLLLQQAHRLKKEEAALSLDVMKMLGFLEQNQKAVYVREASMLVYGSSKYFEQPHLMSAVCRTLRDLGHAESLYEEREDLVLEKYYVFNVEQEIRIRGRVTLHFRNTDVHVEMLADGIAVSSADLNSLVSVEMHAGSFMTIENKTSFERYDDPDAVCMYLGGYAGRHQIAFINKVFQDNPDCRFVHFGDIDAGGLKIHQNLCRMTGIRFEMFHMGSAELHDPVYASCLQPLSENDLANLQSIENLPVYKDTVAAMKERGKLEQEIISLTLMERKK